MDKKRIKNYEDEIKLIEGLEKSLNLFYLSLFIFALAVFLNG